MDCLWGFGEVSTSRCIPPPLVQLLSECLCPLSDFLAYALGHLLQRIQVEFDFDGVRDVDLQTPRAFGCQGLVRLRPFEYLPQALFR